MTANAPRIEHKAFLTLRLSCPKRDFRELAFRIDRQHRAAIEQQVRDHQRDAFTRPRSRDRQHVTVIADAQSLAAAIAEKNLLLIVAVAREHLTRISPSGGRETILSARNAARK